MKVKELLCYSSSSTGTVRIEGMGGNRVSVIGTSLKTKVECRHANTAYIAVENGERGIVALDILVAGDRTTGHAYIFLEASWNMGDRPTLDLEHQWIPRPDRIANFVEGYIVVWADEIRFTNHRTGQANEVVVDPNDLCLYMDGKIKVDELRRRNPGQSKLEEAEARATAASEDFRTWVTNAGILLNAVAALGTTLPDAERLRLGFEQLTPIERLGCLHEKLVPLLSRAREAAGISEPVTAAT